VPKPDRPPTLQLERQKTPEFTAPFQEEIPTPLPEIQTKRMVSVQTGPRFST